MTPEERELLMCLFEGYCLIIGNDPGPNRAHVTRTFQAALAAGILAQSARTTGITINLDDALSRFDL